MKILNKVKNTMAGKSQGENKEKNRIPIEERKFSTKQRSCKAMRILSHLERRLEIITF